MELQDYLRALRTHWLGVAVIVALVLAGAAAYTLTQEKVYAANATGFVGTGETDNAALGSVNDQLAKSRATSYVDIAKSRATAEQVIENLGLDESPSSLASRVEVEQPTDTVLLKITVRAESPEKAQELADAWVAALADQVEEIEAPDGNVQDGTPRVIPIESAELPTAPVSPNPQRNALLALVVGLLLGAAYAVVRQQLDRRLRSPEEIERRLGHSVVATIPSAPVLEHERGSSGGLAVSAEVASATPAAEAFRKLRTNLTYMRVDDPPRVIVVTSARPGDGKSTVAANLAAVLDSTGVSVVLVDGDLRRPSAADSFGVDTTGVGLTSVLAGLVPLEDALQQPEGYHRLRVLPAGPPAPIPSELLGSQAMRNVLQSLKREGFVIIDAPPLLPVTDAAVLSTAADGVLMVVSSGRTLDTDVETCIQSVEAVNSEVLGIVLNRASAKQGGYDSYGYGYYTSEGEDAGSERRAARAEQSQQAAQASASRIESSRRRSGRSSSSGSRRR